MGKTKDDERFLNWLKGQVHLRKVIQATADFDNDTWTTDLIDNTLYISTHAFARLIALEELPVSETECEVGKKYSTSYMDFNIRTIGNIKGFSSGNPYQE